MKTVDISADIPYEASQANMDRCVSLTGWKPTRQLEDTIPELIQHEIKYECLDEEKQADFNILVTSISKKIPLIKALRKASQKVGNSGKIIGADVNEDCLGKHFVDDFWKMPKIGDLKIEELLEYCTQNRVSCIIPTRDGELEYFARYKDTFTKVGISVMVSDLAVVTACVDKLLFYEKTKSMGYPTIPTSLDVKAINSTSFVVKERYGAGAKAIGINLTEKQAIEHAAQLENAIFQPFISGQEVSVDIYVDRNGRTKGVVARTRDVIVDGESQVTTTLSDPNLEKLCSRLAEDLQLRGHAVLQLFIGADGQYYIIECNSRFGGASTLSTEVGLDSFYWFLLESQGVDITNYPFLRATVQRKQVRYAEDFVI